MKVPAGSKSNVSSFARRQLEKFGWKEGEGLGKRRDGRKTFVKVSQKADDFGLGVHSHDQQHWWEGVFNTAAGNVKDLDSDASDASSSSSSSSDEEGARRKLVTMARLHSHGSARRADGFRTFVKQSGHDVLTEGRALEDKGKLFHACEGRMLRKYYPLGKLQRVESAAERERALMEKWRHENRATEERRREQEVVGEMRHVVRKAMGVEEEEEEEEEEKRKRKKKRGKKVTRKRRAAAEEEEEEGEPSVGGGEPSRKRRMVAKKAKKKKRRRRTTKKGGAEEDEKEPTTKQKKTMTKRRMRKKRAGGGGGRQGGKVSE